MRGFTARTENIRVEIGEFFKEKFDLQEGGIDQVSRFGKEGRLIMIKFASHQIKEVIMQMKGQVLKGTEFSIQNDLTRRELNTRNHLMDIAKEEQAKGRSAKVVGNKLRLDNKWLQWDPKKEALTQARHRPSRGMARAARCR